MFRRWFLVFLFVFSLSSGCASWLTRFRENPVAVLTETVSYFHTALNLARGAVSAVASVMGDATINSRFETIASSVERGLSVAQDGLRIAADAGGDPPDVERLMEDARQAMRHVYEFISGLSTGPGRAADPLMRDALRMTARAAGIPQTSP